MKARLTAVLAWLLVLLGSETSAQRGPGPMRIVLLVDSSVTVSPMLTPFRAALNGFLDALPGEPEIAIISTGGQLRIRAAPTSDRSKLHAAASAFTADGGGNMLLDTLLEADRRFLKPAADRRSILVILTTDGGTTPVDVRIDAYNRFMDDFQKRGGRAHAIVVRGVNSGVVSQITENITQNTGGYYETVTVATAVPRLMKTLADHVAADQ